MVIQFHSSRNRRLQVNSFVCLAPPFWYTSETEITKICTTYKTEPTCPVSGLEKLLALNRRLGQCHKHTQPLSDRNQQDTGEEQLCVALMTSDRGRLVQAGGQTQMYRAGNRTKEEGHPSHNRTVAARSTTLTHCETEATVRKTCRTNSCLA